MRMQAAALLFAASLLAIAPAHAENPGLARRAWYGIAAAGMNVLPVASAFASQRCLPGYIACKLSFAGMGLIASTAQIIIGGDIDGARRTARRAIGGDWIVTPRHVAEGASPDPYPAPPRDENDMDLPAF